MSQPLTQQRAQSTGKWPSAHRNQGIWQRTYNSRLWGIRSSHPASDRLRRSFHRLLTHLLQEGAKRTWNALRLGGSHSWQLQTHAV